MRLIRRPAGSQYMLQRTTPEPRRMILLVLGLLATGPSPLRPETGMEGTENPPSCCPFLSVYSHNMGGSRGTPWRPGSTIA